MTTRVELNYTNIATATRRPVVGERVWTWWDTGAFGVTPLDGVVVASGKRTFTVEWQSGIRNRIGVNTPSIWYATDEEVAE